MKYSFMSFSCPEITMGQIVKIARFYGYDGFEPRIDVGHKHGIGLGTSKSALVEIRRMAEENGIVLCCLATSCSYADPDKTMENIVLGKRCIDLV